MHTTSSILHNLNQLNRAHRGEPTTRDQLICDAVHDVLADVLAIMRSLGDLGRDPERPSTVQGLVPATTDAQSAIETVCEYCRDHGGGGRRSDRPSRTDLRVDDLGEVPAVGEALVEILTTLTSLEHGCQAMSDESLAAMVRRMVGEVRQAYAPVAEHWGRRDDA